MRAVVQRVREARVAVGTDTVGEIGPGAVVLLAVSQDDGETDADWLARKVSSLRIFDDGDGRLNESIASGGGAFLVVSQFTLYGDCRKGNRPSYLRSASPEKAAPLYEAFVEVLRSLGHTVRTGVFGERMLLSLQNDGPVTVLIDSP